MCFNTQPPEGGWRIHRPNQFFNTRFNTQPPEGGWFWIVRILISNYSFNTQPPEGGWGRRFIYFMDEFWFQHTAA